MAYEKQWGTLHPGCLIILLDQSGSMEDKFGGQQIGAGRKKKDMVATVLNSLLNEFVKTNTVGQDVKPRADVAVLGYQGSSVQSALGGSLKSKSFVKLPELMANPINIETRTKKEMDDTGNIIEIPVYFPIWVEPKASGGTPMCAAFRQAKALAEEWVNNNPDNYPPVVINITDGVATDGDITGPIDELSQVRTSDGNTLLFNCHLTEKNASMVEFPTNESQIPNNKYAKLLFSLSSEVPKTACHNIESAVGQSLPPGARGFIFNGDASAVRQMFIFATVGATQGAIDPNR